MPTSLILDRKFKLPKSCGLNDENGKPHKSNAIYHLFNYLDPIFNDYIIDDKHCSIKIIAPTFNQDYDTSVDNIPSFANAFTDAVYRRLANISNISETFKIGNAPKPDSPLRRQGEHLWQKKIPEEIRPPMHCLMRSSA